MQQSEQDRAFAERDRQTQLQLANETARRRGVGIRSLLGPLGSGLTTTFGSG